MYFFLVDCEIFWAANISSMMGLDMWIFPQIFSNLQDTASMWDFRQHDIHDGTKCSKFNVSCRETRIYRHISQGRIQRNFTWRVLEGRLSENSSWSKSSTFSPQDTSEHTLILATLLASRPKRAASLHKQLQYYHKYFFNHIYPGRSPGQCYSSHKQEIPPHDMLKICLLKISTASFVLHLWEKSTLVFTRVGSTGLNPAIRRGLKSWQEWRWSSPWMITTRRCACIFCFIFWRSLIQH